MSEQPTDETFVVTAVHEAPRDLVFEVMTTPEHLTHFWGPSGTHTPLSTIVLDLRPGGAFETTIVNDRSGDTFTMRAIYLEVDPPRYLSWRELDSQVVTEVRFTDLRDGSTQVETTQRGLPPAMRTPAARAGWSTALERSAAYIVSLVTPDVDG